MIVKNIISEMLPNMWPMIVFICVVAISLRLLSIFKGRKKFVLHKEILSLIFIIYILCLYHILICQDGNTGINLVPFKEMFRYSFGSYKFIKNIVGNIVLFIPFGFFASYYLNNKKTLINIISTLIVSLCAEGIQYYIGRVFDIDDIILNVLGGFIGYLLFMCLVTVKSKLPRFMRSDAFINTVIIIVLVLIILFSLNVNIFSYL